MRIAHAIGMLVAFAFTVKLCCSDGPAPIATGAFHLSRQHANIIIIISGCCRVAYVAWSCTAAYIALPPSHKAALILASPIPHAVLAATLGRVCHISCVILLYNRAPTTLPQLLMKQHLVVQATTTVICWWTSSLAHRLHNVPMRLDIQLTQALAAAVLATLVTAAVSKSNDVSAMAHHTHSSSRRLCSAESLHWYVECSRPHVSEFTQIVYFTGVLRVLCYGHARRSMCCHRGFGRGYQRILRGMFAACHTIAYYSTTKMSVVNQHYIDSATMLASRRSYRYAPSTLADAPQGIRMLAAMQHSTDASAAAIADLVNQLQQSPMCGRALLLSDGGVALRAAMCSRDEALALAALRLLLLGVQGDPSMLEAMARRGVLRTLAAVPLAALSPCGVRLAALATAATLADTYGAHATLVKVCVCLLM